MRIERTDFFWWYPKWFIYWHDDGDRYVEYRGIKFLNWVVMWRTGKTS